MLNLNSDVNLPAGAFLVFGDFLFSDGAGVLSVPVELRSAPDTDSLICAAVMTVANGQSTLLARQTTPGPGLSVGDMNRYFLIGTRATPTGYTDAFEVVRVAANTPAARKTALEAHMLSAGHISPASFSGTVA